MKNLMGVIIGGRYARLTSTVVVLSTLLAVSPAAIAQSAGKFQITTHLGYRMGGEFEDYASGRKLNVSDDQSYGFSIESIAGPSGIEYGLFYSLQQTQLETGGLSPSINVDTLDVEYIHLRGKRRMSNNSGLYSVGSLGVTRFDPDAPALSSESRFSLGAGGGIEKPLSPRISLQLEGRGFATFFDSSGALFCSSQGSCSVTVAGSIFLQFEVAAALVFRF